MKFKYLLLLVLAFALSAWLSIQYREHTPPPPILESQRSYETTQARAVAERTAIETMLGPFRGLIIGTLGWRMERAQQNEKIFEVASLAEWICTLQPANGKVWAFLGHNLTYNIANTFPDGPSRFPWVLGGIKLMLDKGVVYAPNSENLKHELATLILGKFSISYDPTVAYNRFRFASMMQQYFRKGNRAELERLAYVDTEPQYFAQFPVVKNYLEDVKLSKIGDLLDLNVWNDTATLPHLQTAQLITPEFDTAIRWLTIYHQAQTLKLNWKMSPKRMLWIDKEYGPFDWRMPYGMVVYWDAQGGYDWLLKQPYSRGNNIRIAIQFAFQEGRLMYLMKNDILSGPNHEVIFKYIDYWTQLARDLKNRDRYENYLNFLKSAVSTLYFAQEETRARELFNRYIALDSSAERNFDLFVEDGVRKMVDDSNRGTAQNLIENALIQHFIFKNSGYERQAAAYLKFAKMVWQRNVDEYTEEFAAHRRLPPFEQIVRKTQMLVKEKMKVKHGN